MDELTAENTIYRLEMTNERLVEQLSLAEKDKAGLLSTVMKLKQENLALKAQIASEGEKIKAIIVRAERVLGESSMDMANRYQ